MKRKVLIFAIVAMSIGALNSFVGCTLDAPEPGQYCTENTSGLLAKDAFSSDEDEAISKEVVERGRCDEHHSYCIVDSQSRWACSTCPEGLVFANGSCSDFSEVCPTADKPEGNLFTCEDAACQSQRYCAKMLGLIEENTESDCKDGEDNDSDARIDCMDAGCHAFAYCVGKTDFSTDEYPGMTICAEASDCKKGFICRPDHRCSVPEFETEWEISEDNLKLQLGYDDSTSTASKCAFDVDWGDGSTGKVSDCTSSDMTHTYASAGTYTVKITGTYDGFSMEDSPSKSQLKKVVTFGPVGLGASAFYKCNKLESISMTDIPDASKLTNMSRMFAGDEDEPSNFNLPVDHWDVSNVTDMSYTFFYATQFDQPLNNWVVSKVENLSFTFCHAESFNQPIARWNVSRVNNMVSLFENTNEFNQPINSWNVSNVTDMKSAFNDTVSFNQPLDQWNVSRVVRMDKMFKAAIVFNQPLNPWDVSHVSSMTAMFAKSEAFDQPLNKWNISNVTSMKEMFQEAKVFDEDISAWNPEKLLEVSNMFELSGLSQENFCKLASNSAWKKLVSDMGVSFSCN